MAALDTMVVVTALGAIRLDLDISIEVLQWTVNAFTLSFAVLLLTGAALGDRFGRRRMFAAGLALFTAASIACALARSAGWLIAARALQGAGAALITPLAMALLSAAFPKEERGKALGLYSGIIGLALIFGPVLGGVVVTGLAWQWIFWINVPIGLILMALVLRRIPESFGPPQHLDVGGLLLVTGSAFAVAWSLMHGNEAGWASAELMASLLAGIVLAAAFVAWENRALQPMVPMRLFHLRAFAAGIQVSFLLYASMYSVLFLLPQFFLIAQGHDALGTGLRLLPWTATLFVFAPIGGRLINRAGERLLVVGGLLMQALGFAWISLIAEPALLFATLLAPLVLAGAGVSIAMPAAQNAVLSSVSTLELGKASGIFNMARFLGGTFGVALVVAAFAATGSVASERAFSGGFTTAIGVAAVLSLAAAIAALALPAKREVTTEQAKVKA